MELRVLGCQGPYPGAGGATSGYLFSHGETRLLVECGSGVLAELWRHIAPEQLSAVALSHLHADHMADLLVLRYQWPALMAAGRPPLRVIAPEEPALEYELLSQGPFALTPPMPGEAYAIGELTVRFFPVRHPVPSFATAIEAGGRRAVYSGDTNTAEGLADFARDADLLLIDAAFTDAQWEPGLPHLSARLAAEVAREAGAQRLVLTHFAPGADLEQLRQEAEEVFPGVEMASRGAVWTI